MRYLYFWICSFVVYRFIQCQTTTVYNQADVESLAQQNPTVTGDLVIASSVAGSLNLNGIREVEQNLWCDDAIGLKSLSSDSLQYVGGDIILRNLTTLETISIPKLYIAVGIYWWGLLALDKVDIASNQSGLDTAAGATKSLSKIRFLSVGNSFMSSLESFAPVFLVSFELYQNPRLKDLNLSNLERVKNITITKNNNLQTLNLEAVEQALFVNLEGNFTGFRGLEKTKTVKQFVLTNAAPHDCTQYSRFGEADIHCVSPNSKFDRARPNLLVNSRRLLTEFSVATMSPSPSSVKPGFSQTTGLPADNSATPTSDSTQANRSMIPAPVIAIIAVTSVFLVALLAFFCIWRYRAVKMNRVSQHPNMSELPPGQRLSHIELAVHERPGEHFVATHRTPSASELAALPSAHIVDVKEVEMYPHPNGDEAASSAVLEKHPGLSRSEVVASDQVIEEEDKKLEVLKMRLDKVRNERERLSKLQELEELERVLQEEVMEKQRNLLGRVNK